VLVDQSIGDRAPSDLAENRLGDRRFRAWRRSRRARRGRCRCRLAARDGLRGRPSDGTACCSIHSSSPSSTVDREHGADGLLRCGAALPHPQGRGRPAGPG